MRSHSWLQAALPPALALAALVAIGTSPTVSAQAGNPQQRTLFVSALDANGIPVEGLGPDDFLVRENGVRREVLQVSRASDPIDLTVIVDNSDAISGSLIDFRKALPKFLSVVAPNNRTTLVGIADRPTVLVPGTTDVKALVKRAEGLMAVPSSGMTLLDGVTEISQGLLKREAPRAVIVAIFTDGTEFTNRYSKDVVAALRKAHAAMHVVTIGRFFDDSPHENRERNFFISQAPPATGGSHVSMLIANGLEPALDKLAREINSQYKVVYGRPDSLIPAESVEVTPAKPGLTVRGTPERPKKGA
jgi:hypothetical protein